MRAYYPVQMGASFAQGAMDAYNRFVGMQADIKSREREDRRYKDALNFRMEAHEYGKQKDAYNALWNEAQVSGNLDQQEAEATMGLALAYNRLERNKGIPGFDPTKYNAAIAQYSGILTRTKSARENMPRFGEVTGYNPGGRFDVAPQRTAGSPITASGAPQSVNTGESVRPQGFVPLRAPQSDGEAVSGYPDITKAPVHGRTPIGHPSAPDYLRQAPGSGGAGWERDTFYHKDGGKMEGFFHPDSGTLVGVAEDGGLGTTPIHDPGNYSRNKPVETTPGHNEKLRELAVKPTSTLVGIIESIANEDKGYAIHPISTTGISEKVFGHEVAYGDIPVENQRLSDGAILNYLERGMLSMAEEIGLADKTFLNDGRLSAADSRILLGNLKVAFHKSNTPADLKARIGDLIDSHGDSLVGMTRQLEDGSHVTVPAAGVTPRQSKYQDYLKLANKTINKSTNIGPGFFERVTLGGGNEGRRMVPESNLSRTVNVNGKDMNVTAYAANQLANFLFADQAVADDFFQGFTFSHPNGNPMEKDVNDPEFREQAERYLNAKMTQEYYRMINYNVGETQAQKIGTALKPIGSALGSVVGAIKDHTVDNIPRIYSEAKAAIPLAYEAANTRAVEGSITRAQDQRLRRSGKNQGDTKENPIRLFSADDFHKLKPGDWYVLESGRTKTPKQKK